MAPSKENAGSTVAPIEDNVPVSIDFSSTTVETEGTLPSIEIDICKDVYIVTTKVAPDGGFGWFVALMTFVITFTLTGFLKSYGIVRPAIMAEFPGTTSTEATWISGLIGTLSLLSSPVTGTLMASFGHCSLVMTGAGLCSTGLAISYFATSAKFLIASLGVCMGVGASFLITSAVGCTGKYFTTRKPTAMTIALSGGCIGAIVMPYAVGGLLAALGLRFTFLVMAGVFILIACGGFVYGDPEVHFLSVAKEVTAEEMEEPVPSPQQAPRPCHVRFAAGVAEKMALRFLLNPVFLLTAACIVAISMGTPHFMGQLVAHAKKVGVDAKTASWLVLIAQIGDLLARIFYGLLAPKSPFHRSAEFAATLSAVATCVLCMTFVQDFWLMAILHAVASFGAGILMIMIPLLLSSNHGPKNMSCTLNLIRWFQGFAGIAYRLLSGLIIVESTLSVLLLFNGVLLTVAAVFALVLYLLVAKHE